MLIPYSTFYRVPFLPITNITAAQLIDLVQMMLLSKLPMDDSWRSEMLLATNLALWSFYAKKLLKAAKVVQVVWSYIIKQ